MASVGLYCLLLIVFFGANLVLPEEDTSPRYDKMSMPVEEEAIPGRDQALEVSEKHAVNGNRCIPPFPDDTEVAIFAMGCFWGAEKLFWRKKGVYSTQVGYSGGFTHNPTYQEVRSGGTGHTEVVRVVFRPQEVTYKELLKEFWENHDPTQGFRQGVDSGTSYRSAIFYLDDKQQELAESSRDAYQQELTRQGFGKVTSEIERLKTFYYAEDYHQQYLHKNPDGFCGDGGTGVSCPLNFKIKNLFCGNN